MWASLLLINTNDTLRLVGLAEQGGLPRWYPGLRDQVLGWSISSSLEAVVFQCGERKMLRMKMRTRMKEEDRRLVLVTLARTLIYGFLGAGATLGGGSGPRGNRAPGACPSPGESDTWAIPEDGVN